jgi:hypothetical protein
MLSARGNAPSPRGCGVVVNLLKCVQTEFSRGYGDWLINQRVGLVCSTYRTGYLLFVGVRADGVPVPSAAGFSLAAGLAASSQRIYLGTKNEIWRLENILAPDELANDMFDRFYAPRNAQITGDINIRAHHAVLRKQRFSGSSRNAPCHIRGPRLVMSLQPTKGMVQ